MSIEIILGLVGSLVGGGALGAMVNGYFTSRSQDKKTEVDATDRLIVQWEALLKPLQLRVAELEGQVLELRDKELDYLSRIKMLETQLLLFESSQVDIPLPMWMKDLEGKMIFLNKETEAMFLTPRGLRMDDYIGKKDEDLWEPEIAKSFRQNDKEALRTGKMVRAIERVADGSGGYFYVEVVKFPRKIGNNIIGIAGLVLETSTNKEDL